MSSAGFKITIPASERPQTHTLDRAATGIGVLSRLHRCTAKCLMLDDSVRWVGPLTLGRRSRYVPSKCRTPHTQRRSVTCQKTGITPLLHRCYNGKTSHFACSLDPTCNFQFEISSSLFWHSFGCRNEMFLSFRISSLTNS